MLVANVLPGLAGQPSENLVRDLEPGSTYIKRLKERFSRATENVSIISCYELRQTPQSEFHPDGSIVRSGKNAMNAPESTACLYWANETRIPINENHSMIAKLDKRDGSAFHRVTDSICELVDSFERQGVSSSLRSTHTISHHNSAEAVQSTGSLSIVTVPQPLRTDGCLHTGNSIIMQNLEAKDACTPKAPEEQNTLSLFPLKYQPSRLASDQKTRVYVHGVWDLFHHG